MAKKRKEPATQRTLRGDPTPSYKANSQGSREFKHQEVPETSVEDTTEHPLETQTKRAIESAENSRDSVRDPTRDPAVDPVGGHRGNLTGGAQLQPQQNRGLIGDANLQPQRDIDAIEVDPPEVPDPRIVEVVADQTIANKADDLSNSVSDSEIRTCIAVLRKQKERAELKAKLERLKRKNTGGFVGKQHQMNSNNHSCQLSLERSKRIQDPNVYSALSQRKLTMYLSQVNDVFRQKPITYLTKMDKVLFAANYLAGVIRNKWKSEDKQITADPNRNHTFAGYCKFLQEHIKPVHIRQVETMM